MFVASLLETAVSLTLAFLVSWRLALLGIAIGGTILLILGPFVRISKKAGRRQQSSTQGFVTLLSDILIGIKPLKAMARQEHFLPLFARETRSLRRALRRQAIGENMVNEMREPIFMVFAVIGIYIAQARFTVPMSELLVMAMLLYRTVGSLGRVQRQLQRAIVLEASHRAVHRLIDEVGAEREEFAGTPAADAGARLRVRAGLVRLRRQAGAGRGLADHPGQPPDGADGALRRRQDHDRRSAARPLRAAGRAHPGRRRAARRDRPRGVARHGRLRAAGAGAVPRQRARQPDARRSRARRGRGAARRSRPRAPRASSPRSRTASRPPSASAACSSRAASASGSRSPGRS